VAVACCDLGRRGSRGSIADATGNMTVATRGVAEIVRSAMAVRGVKVGDRVTFSFQIS